jgi:hypothetical protein
MRSKDTLVLGKLYSKVLTEKFYSYDPPQDKKTLMYDFYVINYLQFLLSLPSQGFRDLPDDIVESVKTAAQKLYPYLKKELLDAVFFSICAEFRHFSDYSENYQRIENMYGDNENITKFFNLYDRYRKFYKKGSKEQEELTKIFGVEKPSAQNRPPEIEKKEGLAERVTSYKAVNYALEQTGMGRSFFVSLARDCYIKLIWSSSYGGDAWCGICKGWLLLDAAEKMESTASVSAKAPEAEVKGKGEESEYYKQKAERTKKAEAPAETKQLDVPAAIDHIYDLQHNTDTVFNKLRSYYKGGYGWIEQALTDKANVKSYYELLKKTSGTIRALAPRILYNKLGQTWEDYTKNKTPDSNSSIPKIKSKETKCGDIPRYQETRNSKPEKDPFDQGNFPMTPAKKDKVEYKDIVELYGKPQGTPLKVKNHYYISFLWNGKGGKNLKLYDSSKSQIVDILQNADKGTQSNTPLAIANWVNDTIEKYEEKNNPDSSSKTNTQSDQDGSLTDEVFTKFLEKNYKTVGATLPIGEFVIKVFNISGGSVGLAVEKENEPYSQGGESFQKWLLLPLSPKEISSFVKRVNDFIKKKTESNVKKDNVYITPEDLMYVLDVMGSRTPYQLKDKYTIAWEEYPNDPAYTNIYIVNPQGETIHKIKEEDPKTQTKELAKMINNYIKVDVAKGTLTKKGLISPSSSASGILNQGVYVTGNDIKDLLKLPQQQYMKLKDGYHISYWKSSAVPSQEDFVQFRVWKLKDGDNKLIHNMTGYKFENGTINYDNVASNINEAIKEDKKQNQSSKPYDPTKAPSYMPSVGFSPTGYKQEEQEEEPEYSFDEEEDIEDGYINVKALKFVFYSGKLDLGDGYMATVGPKINGPSKPSDPFKILEIKKGKKVIFSDRLYESHVEDNFQKVKAMAETINNKIKEEEGDMDSDPPIKESFKGFFFRTV